MLRKMAYLCFTDPCQYVREGHDVLNRPGAAGTESKDENSGLRDLPKQRA